MSQGSQKVVLAALGGNAIITLAKFIAAIVGGSVSMLAESVHSLADTGNQGLLLLGGHLGRKDDPARYPLGRATEVYFWSFVVAMMLFLLGGVFAVYEGVHKLMAPPERPSLSILSILVLVVSIAAEGYSFTIAFREFRKQRADRPLREALFAGKDPTIPIVLLEDTGALIGLLIALSAILTSWLSGSATPDAVGSVLIGTLLCVIGLLLARDIKSLLIGESATLEDRQTALRAIEGTPGVQAVTQLLTYQLGPDSILLALKIRFAPDLDVAGVEKAVDALEDRARAAVPAMKRIFVEPDGDYAVPEKEGPC